MSWRRHGDGIVPCGKHKRWRDSTWAQIPCVCRMRSGIKKIPLLYCWRLAGWRKHRHSSGTSAMDHPRYYHIEYTSPMFTRAWWEHRRYIADVSGTFWTSVYIAGCPPTVVCCSALFGDISQMVLGEETSGDNLNACIDFFLDVPMPWRNNYSRMSPIIRRTTGALWHWQFPNLCITKT